jgi:hypothetical protein
MTARIGYALALAAATGAPIQVADQVIDQLAIPAQDDLLGPFTREVPPPRAKHHRFAPVPGPPADSPSDQTCRAPPGAR